MIETPREFQGNLLDFSFDPLVKAMKLAAYRFLTKPFPDKDIIVTAISNGML